MTKSHTKAFLDSIKGSRDSEAEALKAAFRGGASRRITEDGSREVDIVFPGRTETQVSSLRPDGQAIPTLKLRRYQATKSGLFRRTKVSSASVGVDLEAEAFSALVADTEAKTGARDQEAIDATIEMLLDRASDRSKVLDPNHEEKLSQTTTFGRVVGRTRGDGTNRVDDYIGVSVPATRVEPQRERTPAGQTSRPKRRAASQDDRTRDERVMAAAQRKARTDAKAKVMPPIKRIPSRKGNEIEQ